MPRASLHAAAYCLQGRRKIFLLSGLIIACQAELTPHSALKKKGSWRRPRHSSGKAFWEGNFVLLLPRFLLTGVFENRNSNKLHFST